MTPRKSSELSIAQLQDDPGLQPERTLLSWRRTLMSLIVCTLLSLRWLPQTGALALMPIIFALFVSLQIRIAIKARYRVSKFGLKKGSIPPPLREVILLAAVVFTLALLTIIQLFVLH